MASSSPDRAINPVRCWLRHVRRTAAGESGTTIAGGVFIREPGEALGGGQGWQSGRVSAALSDTGELSVVLPNAIGEDGKRHARRFAYFTDPAYRPGEEWLEVYREPHDVLAVCTPYKGRKDRQRIELVGYDVAGLLNRFTGSELDVWDGHAPRDVFEHYCRAPSLIVGTDFAGFSAASSSWLDHGVTWTLSNPAVGPHGGPRLNGNGTLVYSLTIGASFPTGLPAGDCWTAELRGRISQITDTAAGYVFVGQAGVGATAFLDGRTRIDGTAGAASRTDGPPGPDALGKLRANPSGALSMRVVVRYDRCWLLVNGEVALEWRRNSTAVLSAGVVHAVAGGASVVITADGCTFDVDSYHIEGLRPFALRGTDKGSYRLPGIPPAGGLRARYYNAASAQANYATYPARVSHALDLNSEPVVDRLEPAIDVLKGDTVPSMAGAYLARWTGAIYLDLAASDRNIRLGEQGGYARVLIGRTLRNIDELVKRWPTLPTASFEDSFATNLMRASSAAAETDITGWVNVHAAFWGGTASTISRITDANVIHGLGSLKVVTTAVGFQGAFATVDPTLLATFLSGTPYRAVVYLRGAVGGESVQVGLGGTGDSAVVTATLPGPTADPLAVQVDWTPTANRSATDGNYVLAIRSPGVAATFYVDRARVTHRDLPPASNALRATLGSEAGWYPIVVEAYKPDNVGGFLLEDRNVADASATAWQLVGPARLSPIGCFEEHLRNESHRGVLDTLTETFGYQWRTDPRTLETGEFPGQIIPRVRVGRDTNKTLDDGGGVDVVVDSAADETVDSLLADAAGIADPNGSGQLSAQVIDYTNALAHLGMHSAYQSLADMSERTGLETRLGSLLALGSSPSEQVGVRPTDGSQDLVDTWPLTGVLAKLRWLPGDGLRLNLRDVDVIDRTPRQLTRVELGVAPNKIDPPIVGFRQRPRSPAAVLKRTLRAVYALGRNYQGTMTLIPGSVGSATGNAGIPTVTAGGAVDLYTRLPLPANLDNIDRVWLSVLSLTAGTAVIELNGTSVAITVSAVGLYDVTPFVARAGGTQGRCYVRLINGTTGNSIEYMLLGRFRI